MAKSMDLKFQKYWNDIHDLLTVAVVIDPRFKLELFEYYAEKFGSAEPNLHSASVRSLMFDLVREYQSLKRTLTTGQLSGNTNSASSSQIGSSSKFAYADFEHYVSQRKKSKVCSIQSELDHYLSDDIVLNSDDFDILLWWRINSPKYPTLGDIARDFLAVPITSVASESAFSAGGQLLDPHRSRLHHKTVEALMCTRTWLQDDLRKYNEAETSQLEGLFSLLEVNDIVAEEEAEDEDQLQKNDICGSVMEDID
ncbi:Zinc finger BED domain-containing protein RICESLEEPER 2 [Linum grandiflorum]